jgi:hypothetical protein
MHINVSYIDGRYVLYIHTFTGHEVKYVRTVRVWVLLGVVRCVGPRRALAQGQGEVSRL